MYCSSSRRRTASHTGLACSPFRAITASGPQLRPPSTDCFWHTSRLMFLLAASAAASHALGSQPSPVQFRHSAKAFSVALSPESDTDGIRMQG